MSTAAARAREALALTNGNHDARPWNKAAEELLAAAELAEAGARSAAARAVSVGAPNAERVLVAALLDRAEALRVSLARRKHLGAITPEEMVKARAVLARVHSGRMPRSAVVRANRRRLDRLASGRRAVQAEFESAGTSAEMVRQMADALLAENQRAAGHMRRLREGTALSEANHLVDWSYRAYTAFKGRADEHRGDERAMPKADWNRAVDDLAGLRHGIDRLEARLKLGAI